MAYSFIYVFSSSSIAKSGDKTSTYSVYSMVILVKALSYTRTASRNARERYIAISKAFKTATYITNISDFLSQAALANLYLLINSTHLVRGKASAVLHILQLRFPVSNYISILLRDKKNIFRTIFILVLASK